MSLNILGGLIKGHSLLVPPENLTRPTAAQLKRRIFDSNQNLSGVRFIDLCAGSGSVGIEAWSRGADQVILVEHNKKVMSFLTKNLKKINEKFDDELKERPIELVTDFSEKWLKKKWEKSYDSENTIIYLDPPYEKIKVYEKVIESLLSGDFSGELWLEGCRQKGKEYSHWCTMLPDATFKVYEQGTSFIIRFIFGKGD
jgi:16S rRNA (guanine966-N2)-methyltransferase